MLVMTRLRAVILGCSLVGGASGCELIAAVDRTKIPGSGFGGAGGVGTGGVGGAGGSGGAEPACEDAAKNGAETDVDCGGPDCEPCLNDQTCLEAADCQSGFCDARGICAPCGDSGDCAADTYCEADVCVPDKMQGDGCAAIAECPNDNCIDGFCCDSACTAVCQACDVVGTEGTCTPHAVGTDPEDDCDPDVCSGGGTCRCMDNATNGDETDTDCGGGICPQCADGSDCVDHDDCQSLTCISMLCEAPECGDGVQQATEGCDDGNQSNSDDCPDGINGTCEPASCTDNFFHAGNETDVDCGGTLCPPCSLFQACQFDSDCETGNCVATTCSPVEVDSTTPADGATGVAPLVSGGISITFTGAVAPATLTLQTQLQANLCTGSIQLSADPSFTSCIPFATAAPAMSVGNTVATLTPSPALSYGTTYWLRVTSTVTDAQSTPITPFDMVTGFTTQTDALPSGAAVVINQVYPAGGEPGATFDSDFVELYNRGGASVDVSGWSLQYADALASTWQVVMLNGNIPPGGYYLVALASGTAGGPLPTPDETDVVSLDVAEGKLALRANGTAFSSGCPSGAVDFVGYGSAADCFEGVGPATGMTVTLAVHRGACSDTNDNAADFAALTANPRNSATAPSLCDLSVVNETNTGIEADFCNVQFPASLSVQTGMSSGNVFGRIFELGVTEAGGANPLVRAQLGFGPRAANPQTESGWTWIDAVFNVQFMNDDEYMASFTAPAPGTYSYAYRFTLDGGLSFTVCDLDGAGSNSTLGFQVTQLPELLVTP